MSAWTIETCGIMVTGDNGHRLGCGEDTKSCPDDIGIEVLRNAANKCEFHVCPSDVEASMPKTTPKPTRRPTVNAAVAGLPSFAQPTLPYISRPSQPTISSPTTTAESNNIANLSDIAGGTDGEGEKKEDEKNVAADDKNVAAPAGGFGIGVATENDEYGIAEDALLVGQWKNPSGVGRHRGSSLALLSTALSTCLMVVGIAFSII